MNIFYLVVGLCFIKSSIQSCCATFIGSSKKCQSCPVGTHLFRNNCITDVENCETYADGFDCQKCKSGFTAVNGQCLPQSANNLPPSSVNFVDKYFDDLNNVPDSILILSDYSRSVNTQLQTADVLFSAIRSFPNGTDHTIVYYQTKTNKFFESIAQFDKVSVFSFRLIIVKQLASRPVKVDPNNPNNSSNNNSNNTNNSNSNNSNSTNPSNNGGNPVGMSKLNYVYLNFDDRKKDKGFILIDMLVRGVNTQQLGTDSIVLAAYSQRKGLNTEYIIYYESSDKKSIYENKSIYQIIKNKALIISFFRTNLK